MNEKNQFRDAMIKLAIICVCAILYCLGGAEFGWGKWLRRFLMPFIMVGGMFWFSRDWRSLISFPLLCIGLSLGYGADETWLKIIKRGYCGLLLGVGSSIGDWLNKRFLISISQTVLVTTAMILLGAFNPLPNARLEELAIGLSISALPIINARPK